MDLKLKDREELFEAQETKSATFEAFMKKHDKEIDLIKREIELQYGVKLAKAGMQELLLMLWLMEDSDEAVLNKLKKLLQGLFQKGLFKFLSAFKLVPEKKAPKRRK
ncbi:MAG: hypothetical protein GXN92_02800 [Candidatus Micrarchaeota archaeon]|nr:hypothetical protein [Candidatus Micrarchaeota archaeon]